MEVRARKVADDEYRQRYIRSNKKWALTGAKSANQRYYDKVKASVFEYYGNKCACCGESTPQFLTIDHVNNDGNRDYDPVAKRRINSTGFHLYRRIIREGFPDAYQLLCWNCNCGKARNGGVCPHKTQVKEDHMNVGTEALRQR